MIKKSISIIDDSENVLELLADDLGSSYNVKTYISVDECFVDLEKSKLPDVFISDFKMPDKTGLDFANLLIEKEITVPVIILTGAADKDVAIASLKSGVFGLIEKPYNLLELESMVDKAISRAKSLTLNGEILTEFQKFIRYVDEWSEVSFDHILQLEKKLYDNDLATKSHKDASLELKVRHTMKKAEMTVNNAKTLIDRMLKEYEDLAANA